MKKVVFTIIAATVLASCSEPTRLVKFRAMKAYYSIVSDQFKPINNAMFIVDIDSAYKAGDVITTKTSDLILIERTK